MPGESVNEQGKKILGPVWLGDRVFISLNQNLPKQLVKLADLTDFQDQFGNESVVRPHFCDIPVHIRSSEDLPLEIIEKKVLVIPLRAGQNLIAGHGVNSQVNGPAHIQQGFFRRFLIPFGPRR